MIFTEENSYSKNNEEKIITRRRIILRLGFNKS